MTPEGEHGSLMTSRTPTKRGVIKEPNQEPTTAGARPQQTTAGRDHRRQMPRQATSSSLQPRPGRALQESDHRVSELDAQPAGCSNTYSRGTHDWSDFATPRLLGQRRRPPGRRPFRGGPCPRIRITAAAKLLGRVLLVTASPGGSTHLLAPVAHSKNAPGCE